MTLLLGARFAFRISAKFCSLSSTPAQRAPRSTPSGWLGPSWKRPIRLHHRTDEAQAQERCRTAGIMGLYSACLGRNRIGPYRDQGRPRGQHRQLFVRWRKTRLPAIEQTAAWHEKRKSPGVTGAEDIEEIPLLRAARYRGSHQRASAQPGILHAKLLVRRTIDSRREA